jgi:cytoskeleton-associated protein 5
VVGHLEKARGELPAKPVKHVKAKAAPAAAAAPPASSYDDDDDEPERPATAPAKAPAKGKGGKVVKKAGKAAPAPASKKKGQEEEDTSPPLKVNTLKDQRFKDEKNLKVLKWNFGTPRGEFLDQLRGQMEPSFNRTLVDQLFHADFKNHIKAIDTLAKVGAVITVTCSITIYCFSCS